MPTEVINIQNTVKQCSFTPYYPAGQPALHSVNRPQTHHAALGLDESAQDEPVSLLHPVGRAHAVRVRAPILGGDHGQLPGPEWAVGLDAVGEADHGAHRVPGGARLRGLEPLRLPETDGRGGGGALTRFPRLRFIAAEPRKLS
jgi:hypothetical protein